MAYDVAISALVGSAVSLTASAAYTLYSAVQRRGRRLLHHDPKYKVDANGQSFEIDLSAIDKENPQKIARALRAIRAQREKEIA